MIFETADSEQPRNATKDDGRSRILTCIIIEPMETTTYSAPVVGTPVFRLESMIAVPVRIGINSLRERFAEIQRKENLDLELAAETS